MWCNYVNIFELIGIASRNNNIGAAKDFIHIVLRRSNYEATHQNVISFRVKIFRGTPPAPISIDYQLRIRSCLKFNREIKNFHSFFFIPFFSFCSLSMENCMARILVKIQPRFVHLRIRKRNIYVFFIHVYIAPRTFSFFFFFQRVIKWKNTRRRLSRSTLTYCLFSFPFKCHSFVFFFARKISKRNIPKFRHLSLFFLFFLSFNMQYFF